MIYLPDYALSFCTGFSCCSMCDWNKYHGYHKAKNIHRNKCTEECEQKCREWSSCENLVVDDRDYIYLNAMHDGVYILKCLV